MLIEPFARVYHLRTLPSYWDITFCYRIIPPSFGTHSYEYNSNDTTCRYCCARIASAIPSSRIARRYRITDPRRSHCSLCTEIPCLRWNSMKKVQRSCEMQEKENERGEEGKQDRSNRRSWFSVGVFGIVAEESCKTDTVRRSYVRANWRSKTDNYG